MGKTLVWLYLLAIAMGLLACESKNGVAENANGTVSDGKTATGEGASGQTVLDFLKWYGKNESALGEIEKVKAVEGEPYELNTAGTEAYLAQLKGSGFISDIYLQGERAEFLEIAKELKENPQTDGPATGFDYDRVLLAQDWDDLDKAKIVKVDESGNSSVVVANIAMPLELSLTKTDGKWLIDKIVNPGL